MVVLAGGGGSGGWREVDRLGLHLVVEWTGLPDEPEQWGDQVSRETSLLGEQVSLLFFRVVPPSCCYVLAST